MAGCGVPVGSFCGQCGTNATRRGDRLDQHGRVVRDCLAVVMGGHRTRHICHVGDRVHAKDESTREVAALVLPGPLYRAGTSGPGARVAR
jgi:hypothetical protein